MAQAVASVARGDLHVVWAVLDGAGRHCCWTCIGCWVCLDHVKMPVGPNVVQIASVNFVVVPWTTSGSLDTVTSWAGLKALLGE